MGRRKKGDVPRLCHHKGVERGFARFDGYKATYFQGRWPKSQKAPPMSIQREYEEALTLWLRRRADSQEAKRPGTPYPLVAELWAMYLEHCNTYYRKRGRRTSEYANVVRACRIASNKFGDEYAHRFDVLKLKAVRAEMIAKGWVRNQVNKAVKQVVAMFRWGNEQGLRLASVVEDLRTLAGLKYGRTSAPEAKKIRPAVMDLVWQTLEHLRAPLPDLVRVHYLLGCRAAEVTAMRVREIKHDERGWRFEPESWKTEHHEQDPLIHWIGPECLKILHRNMEGKSTDDYVFPSFRCRSGRLRDGAQRTPYTTASYRRAVAVACTKHKIPRWSPIQIRKARLTAIEVAFDLEHARLSVCHRKVATTQFYTSANQEKARKVAEAMG